jgi:steroid delta-isomerase-like uncharacterized protein
LPGEIRKKKIDYKVGLSEREAEMNAEIEIVKKWLEAMDDHDADQMGSLCFEDAIGDEIANPPPTVGRDGIVQNYRELFAGFPDCQVEVLNIFAGEGQALAEVRWSGTHKAEFRGTPATGKFVDIRIAYLFRIEQGKIHRITEYYDGAAVASQMG